MGIYNRSIPAAHLKSANHHRGWTPNLWLALVLTILPCRTLSAADWSSGEQQLSKKIVAVTGPGKVRLTVENRSSLGRRERDMVQNGLRNALEQSGVHFVRSDEPVASVALTLSENETSYVWVAAIQTAGGSAVVMVSVPRPGISGPASDTMPITLRKVSLFSQDERILDLAVLEENGAAPARMAVLDADKVLIYRLQNATWQAEQAVAIVHTRPWSLDLRGRLVPAVDRTLSAYLPGVTCRISAAAAPMSMSCHPSDDPWPIVSGTLNSPVFPSAGSSSVASAPVSPLAAFFAPTRNHFTGVLSPAIGKFSAVPGFYSAAFITGERSTLWIFAAVDGTVHLVDGSSDQSFNFNWGSDIAALKTGCGAGSQILVTTPGNQGQDSVRAYEFPDREPVAVSAAIDLPGPVSALWSEARGDTAIAIAKNRDTGSYEAFRLSLACNQ